MATIRGGDKLARALAEITAKLGRPATLKVGFLAGGTYPDGTSIPEVAATQNFGTDKAGPNHDTVIPPRPFFSNMVAEKSPEWPAAIEKNLKASHLNVRTALLRVGKGIKDQLQQSIRDTNNPPLKESTIKAKGFDKPLIDDTIMINSVDYQVDTD